MERLFVQIYVEDRECTVSESCGLLEVREVAVRVKEELLSMKLDVPVYARLSLLGLDGELAYFLGIPMEVYVRL